MHTHFRRLYLAIGFLFLSIFAGIVGFSVIENYNITDAFYMTILTISTVGFREVYDLSDSGKIFTSFYIIFNLSAFGFFLSVISRYLFEGELKQIFYRYLDNRELSKLRNHVIVCGFGRNGYKAVEELRKNDIPFVVVDANKDIFERRLDEKKLRGLNIVVGDATQEEVLERAGIKTARAIIAAVPKDAINVFISLTAKELNPKIKVIARATEETSESKLKRAGADQVILPDTIGGQYMANMVIRPEVVEFLDMINGVGEVALHMEEFCFSDLKGEYRNHSIKELNLRQVCGVTIIGYKSKKLGFIFNPNSQTKVEDGDILILIGSSEDFVKFKEVYVQKALLR